MELRICSGIEKLYRLAFLDTDGTFLTLSEHDDADSAVAAKRAMEREMAEAAHLVAAVAAKASAS